MYGKLLRDEVQEKAVRGYSLKRPSHMINRHFDMRLVFHRPYKCMCSAVKYSQGQLLRDVWGWTRHKKEKKRKSWRWNGVPDELSRSGVLAETRHVFNAALILRRTIQSLQPITSFPAEPAELSEKKINVHVPSELYNFL